MHQLCFTCESSCQIVFFNAFYILPYNIYIRFQCSFSGEYYDDFYGSRTFGEKYLAKHKFDQQTFTGELAHRKKASKSRRKDSARERPKNVIDSRLPADCDTLEITSHSRQVTLPRNKITCTNI